MVGTYIFTRFEDQNEGFLTQLKIKIIRSKTLGMLAKKMGLGKYIIISQHVESEHGRTNVRILEDLFESFIGALFLDNGGIPLTDELITMMTLLKKLELEIQEIETIYTETKTMIVPLETYMEKNKLYRHLVKKIIPDRSNGFLICQRFIINVLEKELDLLGLISINDNYKDQIQHYYQRNFKGIFPDWKIEAIEGPTNNRIHTISIADDKGSIIGIGKAKKKIDAEQLASKQALIYLGCIEDSDDECIAL